MARAEWVGEFLSDEIRKEFARELSAVLPGTAEQKLAFASHAEEAVDEYRKLTLPFTEDAELRSRRLELVTKAGYAFARAIANLDEDTKDLLQQAQWLIRGLDSDAPDFKCTIDAAQWSDITAQVANRILAAVKPSKPGPATHPAIVSLIRYLAWA